MSHDASEWKPGDVAMVTRDDGSTTRAIWTRFGYGWQCVEGGPPITDARRLVVIDPEDRDQVARLGDAFCLARWSHIEGSNECDPLTFSSMQEALRQYADPPRIEEPLGLGAVVEDTTGERWIRWEIPGRHPKPWTVPGAIKPNRAYDEIKVALVLSEGVPE